MQKKGCEFLHYYTYSHQLKLFSFIWSELRVVIATYIQYSLFALYSLFTNWPSKTRLSRFNFASTRLNESVFMSIISHKGSHRFIKLFPALISAIYLKISCLDQPYQSNLKLIVSPGKLSHFYRSRRVLSTRICQYISNTASDH